MKTWKMFSALGLAAGFAGAATAAVIASEDFTYADGALAANNGGTGWAGAWTDVSGNAATVAGGVGQTNFGQAERTLSSTVDVTGGVWIRATVQKTDTDGVAGSFGGIGLFNGGAEAGLIGNFWPGVATDAWGAGPNGAQGEIAGDLVTSLSDVVVFIDDTQTLLWVNGNPVALGAAEATGASTGDFDTIRLRNGNGAAETYTYDNILIGDTAADVGVVVPEPGSLALLGLGGLAMLRRRRA